MCSGISNTVFGPTNVCDAYYGVSRKQVKEANSTCYDIDECHEKVDSCTQNQTCINLGKLHACLLLPQFETTKMVLGTVNAKVVLLNEIKDVRI